jgi:hypothetical protein
MSPLAALSLQQKEPERFGRTKTPRKGAWWVKPGVKAGGPCRFDSGSEEVMKTNRQKMSIIFI